MNCLLPCVTIVTDLLLEKISDALCGPEESGDVRLWVTVACCHGHTGATKRPGEDKGLFLGICGVPAACNTATFGIIDCDGILKSMGAFT